MHHRAVVEARAERSRVLALAMAGAIGLLGAARADAPPIALRENPGFGALAFEEFDPSPPGGTLEDARAALRVLEGRSLSLSVHWPSTALDDAARWRLVDEAYARGIAINPVLLLPEGTEADEEPGSPGHATTGYFVNTSNYAAWIDRSLALMRAWRARGLPPTTMVIDMETRKRRLERLAELTGAHKDVLGTLQLLTRGIDRARYVEARRALDLYAAQAHALGFRLHVTTLLPVLDDYQDGDDDLRQALGIPLADDPSEMPWDTVSFQVHRTLYQARFAGITPYFVYEYATMARRLMSTRAAVDLGLTHGGISTTAPLYAGPDELRADVRAALAAGLSPAQLGVYSLTGMMGEGRGPLERWLAPAGAPEVPPNDGVTVQSHLSWLVLDLLVR